MADNEINYSDFIGKDDTFDVIIANLKEIQKELIATAKIAKKDFTIAIPSDTEQVNKLSKEVKELVAANKLLEKQIKVLSKAKKQRKKLTDEELIQAQKEKITQRERVQRAKQLAVIRKEEKNTIKSLRAQLSLVSLDWSKLTAEEIKNSKAAKALSKQKLTLTNQLKKLEKQTGDTRRNVGNYTDSLSKLGKTAARVFLGRSAVDFFRRIVSGANALIQANKKSSESLQGIDDSVNKASGAFTKLAVGLLEFLAPAIVFVLESFTSLVGLFVDLNTGSNEFVATSKELEGTIDSLNKEFVKEVAAVDQVFTALENANEGSEERKNLIDQINTQYGEYLPNLLTEKSSLQEIEAAQRLVNDQLSKNFALKIQNATQTDIFTNKIKSQNASFDSFRKKLEGVGLAVDASLSPAFSELLDKFNDVSGEGAKANRAITGFAFNTEGLADEIAKTNPKLAELIKKILEYRLAGDVTNDTFDFFVETLGNAARETDKYNGAVGESSAIINELNKGLIGSNNSVSSNTSRLNQNTTAVQGNTQARIAAINELQKALDEAEAENIEDAQERALRLEELRFKALQEQRKSNFLELQILLKGQDEELKKAEKLNQRLGEEQLIEHENNKVDIRKRFAIKTIEIEALTEESLRAQREKAIDEQLKSVGSSSAILAKQQKEIALENQKAIDDALKASQDKQKKSTQDLLNTISSASKKVSEIVTNLFKEQADLSAKSVEEQEGNLSAARDRAAKGLEANIAFEEKELAARQSEQIKRQKEQEQAAKILTLFNLVGAYAQNGDKNALARGLVDFSLLEALGSGIQGFYEGTENVEQSLGSSAKTFSGIDAYLGVTDSGKMLRFDGKRTHI